MTNRIILTSGDFLRDFLEELNISSYRLAKETNISQPQIKKILEGKNRITADTALRFSKFFDTTVEYWLNLQQICDIEKAEEDFKEKHITIKKYTSFLDENNLTTNLAY